MPTTPTLRPPRFLHSPLWGQEGRRLYSVWIVDERAERYGETHEELVDRRVLDRLRRVWPFFRDEEGR